MAVPLEWLEADGLGGYASGVVVGPRTRRYHALLDVAASPPTARRLLVSGFDAWVETGAGRFALSSQRYEPGVTHPDGAGRVESFERTPWPRWTFRLGDGSRVVQELFVPCGQPAVVLRLRRVGGVGKASLSVRPFLAGRDHHGLQRENPYFSLDHERYGQEILWRPYPGMPAVGSFSNGSYVHDPLWYRNFRYEEELRRGLDGREDLVSPGVLTWDLAAGEAAWILGEASTVAALRVADQHATVSASRLAAAEVARRGAFSGPLERAADSYLVRRGCGRSLIAGYPWFSDWGRDTFISLRGLCLATGRFAEAVSVLVEWTSALSAGMFPNHFPDDAGPPEYHSVDASLWFVVVAGELLSAARAGRYSLAGEDEARLSGAIRNVLDAYLAGTRYGIHCDDDGLLAAGEPGVALTWMDAVAGGRPVTPRIGKPVEVQALWLNALAMGAAQDARYASAQARGTAAFSARFWNAETGALFDVIDVDHVRGAVDPAFRPNQLFAVGGLPLGLLPPARARRVVQAIETRLWTPMGLRSLAPGEPGYCVRYEGGPEERAAAYHQGTVWPWLCGAFVEAWVRVHGDTPEVRRGARARFLGPLVRHLTDEAGLGHVSELADAEQPHTPRGCPFQAWSVAELLRLDHAVLAEPTR